MNESIQSQRKIDRIGREPNRVIDSAERNNEYLGGFVEHIFYKATLIPEKEYNPPVYNR